MRHVRLVGPLTKALRFAAPCLLWTTTAIGAEKPVYVPSPAAADITLPPQTVTGSEFKAYLPVYLRDPAVTEVAVDAILLGPDGGLVPVVVKRRSPAALLGSAPVRLTREQPLELDLSARLSGPGEYTLSLRITPPGGAVTTVAGKVTLTSAGLPADGIVANPPVSLFSGGDALVVAVPLTGASDRDVSFSVGTPTVTRILAAGEVGAGAVTAAIGKCGGVSPDGKAGAATGTDAARTLPRAGTDALEVAFCGLDRAGDYHARFDLVGSGGGVRHVDVEVKYARSWWLAFLLILTGGVFGAPLAWWRESGRAQANALLSLDRVRDDVVELSAQLGSATRSAHLLPLLDAIARLRSAIVADGPSAASDTQLADLTSRRDLLNRVLWQVARTQGLKPDPGVESALADALDAIADQAADVAAPTVDALAKAVEAARTAALPNLTMGVDSGSGALEPPSFHLFTGRENRAELLRKRRLLDLAASIALFMLFCLTGLVVLWWRNPTWGDFGDCTTAFLVGIAAFGGLASQLGTFRTTVQALK